ncbi:MAG: universal stress protein [Fidelibacterota bacterium]
MNKRIVVGLDGSEFSGTAMAVACEQARRSEGTVVGIGVVDLPGIESVERGAPVGSLYFAKKAEEHKLRDALEKVEGFLEDFENVCKEAGVKYELHSRRGVPFRSIVEAGKVADLIVVGLRTFYHFETSSEAGDTLKRVLRHSVCPVMAVPQTMEAVKNVIIAYDGSTESAKALRAFVNRFHPGFQDVRFTLLTVSEPEQDASDVQRDALAYLASWDVEPATVVDDGKVYEVILRHSKVLDRPMVVMGAYGRSEISELFFGSTARRLVEDATIPIFVYH